MSSKKSRPRATASSSSESDSEPVDKTPPPKKAKTDKKPSASNRATASSNQDNDSNMFQLSKMRFVNVREFRGKVMVDIREYYEANGDLKPGKKGISLNMEQWNALKHRIDEIDDAIKQF
ncbi:activated RNA polymerase II transcriptional coactivator p15-like [Tachypleus tridentatus]|uniref:activated RNA polymerase II transcriptional coactivator p15-like n=1 Tax=Tachypleus tridentatus TaxID=6853 RepID=UPI003FD1D6D3